MRTLTITAILTATLGMTSFAEAGGFGKTCTSAPQSRWFSIGDLQRKVEEQGYKVQKASPRLLAPLSVLAGAFFFPNRKT
jgi:hypothetical protein